MGARIVLAGGAAAAIIAGALYLFPPMAGSAPGSRLSPRQFDAAQDAFAKALAGEETGFARLERFQLASGQVPGADHAVLLKEDERGCAGRGIYWIAKDAPVPLAITAPHRGSDRHTGTLAATLFLETGASAAAWNSSPRRASAPCAHPIDLARVKDHLFSAFALGFAQARPNGLIVQLHGFDNDRRSEPAASHAAMILSNGTDLPDDRLLDLADRLSLAFSPREVLVYPIDSGELGATTNAQGKLLREARFDGFVHIEMSAELRQALIADGELHGRFAEALARAAR